MVYCHRMPLLGHRPLPAQRNLLQQPHTHLNQHPPPIVPPQTLLHSPSLRTLAVSLPELGPTLGAKLIAAIQSSASPKQPLSIECHMALGSFAVSGLERVQFLCVADQDALLAESWQSIAPGSSSGGGDGSQHAEAVGTAATGTSAAAGMASSPVAAAPASESRAANGQGDVHAAGITAADGGTAAATDAGRAVESAPLPAPPPLPPPPPAAPAAAAAASFAGPSLVFVMTQEEVMKEAVRLPLYFEALYTLDITGGCDQVQAMYLS